MAEPCEPGRRGSAGGENPEEEEDEEREPLLPRIAWAQPRRGAPGGAVRQQEGAGDEGAAAPRQARDGELPLPPKDRSRSLSLAVEATRGSPTDHSRNRPSVSGASRSLPGACVPSACCPRRAASFPPGPGLLPALPVLLARLRPSLALAWMEGLPCCGASSQPRRGHLSRAASRLVHCL